MNKLSTYVQLVVLASAPKRTEIMKKKNIIYLNTGLVCVTKTLESGYDKKAKRR